MQAYQNYHYGNTAGVNQGDSNGRDHYGTGRHSGYSPPSGPVPVPAPKAQAQAQGSPEVVEISGTSRVQYGLSPEAQRMVAEEHFNNAILITLLVIGMLFFVYLWFYLSPLFRDGRLLCSKRLKHREAGIITPFTTHNPRSAKVKPGRALSHREVGNTCIVGPGEASCASWKTFRPWSDEWSNVSIKAHAGNGRPPPLYTPRQFAGSSPNTTIKSSHQPSLLSARESAATVPKRISHFFIKSFGSGAGAPDALGTSRIGDWTASRIAAALDGTDVHPKSGRADIDLTYPFDMPPSNTSPNTTTTLLRPCIASRSVSDEVVLHPPAIYIPRPSRVPVYDRYSAFYTQEGATDAKGHRNDDRNIVGAHKKPRESSLDTIPDHPQMGIAF